MTERSTIAPAPGLAALRPGMLVRRIWGDGYMTSVMRVRSVDDRFVYCDAQRDAAGVAWAELPPGAEPWKFDIIYGVETDEEQGWGMRMFGGDDVVLTRIVVEDTP